MFTKALILGTAFAVSAVSLSTFASAKPPMKPILINCAILGTCPIIKPLPFPLPPAPTPAPSGPDFNLNVNLGGGGYGGGYGPDGISCGEGRTIVRHHGFKHVHAMDCSGDVFAYSAFKHGHSVEVDVDSNGGIVDVSSND